MKRLRLSLVVLMGIVAIIALDIAVIQSLLRNDPGSNQTLYLVKINNGPTVG